jgi:hypothetical protein
MGRRLTLAECVIDFGLFYSLVNLGIGVVYLSRGWRWCVLAPDGWSSLLGYAAAAYFAVRTWRYRRSKIPHASSRSKTVMASNSRRAHCR